MGQALPQRMTLFEFLDWEPSQEGKHEFIDGCIVAMSGARPVHNRLTYKLGVMIEAGLRRRGGGCEGFGSDQQVYLHEAGASFYPDFMIACGPQFLKGGNQALENPAVVFEVLSPSTRDYDLGRKLDAYMRQASIGQIVFIDSLRVSVTSFLRVGEGWQKSPQLHTLAETLHIPAIDYPLPLAELYETVVGSDPDFIQGPFLAGEAAATYAPESRA